MATISPSPTPTPEAAALGAAAPSLIAALAGIMGFLGLCWILLGAFFLYHFCKPLKQIDSESTIEPQVASEETEKKWWMDNYEEVCDVNHADGEGGVIR